MTRVGDYVHYHLKNYRQYGISKKGEGSINDAISAFNQQKAAIKKMVKTGKKINTAEISGQLNRYYKRVNNDGHFSQKEEDVLEIAKKIIEDRLKTNANKIDYNSLTVYADSMFSGAVFQQIQQEFSDELKTLKNNPVGSGKNYVKPETIQRRIKFFQDLQKSLNNKNQQGVIGYQELTNSLTKIENEFNQIMSQLQGGKISIKNNKGFLDTINQTMRRIRGTQAVNESGQLAEELSLVMMHMNTLIGAASIEDAVKNLLNNLKFNQGKKNYSRGYDVTLYAPELKEITKSHVGNAAQLNFDLPGSGLTVSVDAKLKGGKQGKVDISFKNKYKQFINASVKNYSVDSDTKIQINSGSNLLLAAQQYPEFLNHYLNIMAAHPSETSKGSLSSWRNLAKEAMKLTLLAHSLVGAYITDKGIMTQNDVLILNNKGVGFNVYSMQDIINNAANNIDAYLDLDKDLDEDLVNDFVEAKNTDEKANEFAAWVRINKLLHQLKVANATAHLKASALGFK